MTGRLHVVDATDANKDAGEFISGLFDKGGAGTRVLLRRKSIWELTTPIFMHHDDTELATEGYPEHEDDMAVLHTPGKSATAVHCMGLSRTAIRNLYIDGEEPEYKPTEGREALIFMCGPGSEDSVIENCVLKNTRGWTCCHVFDQGIRPRIINNRIGPSGHPAPKGPWADGLSIACRDGIVAGNTIIDATDGGIVLFCAPGTLAVNNTIISRESTALGGINMVDFGPYEGDYTHTRVMHNRIFSEGAMIKLGIGIGSRPWGDGSGIGAYGCIVRDNVFGPGNIGYGIAVGGTRDIIVHGNRVSPNTVFEGDTSERNNPAAQPFLKYTSKEEPGGDLQDDFVEGRFSYLIGIEEGLSTSNKYFGGGFELAAGQSIRLRGARLELQHEGQLILWDNSIPGRVFWSSHPGSRLEIRDRHGKLVWSTWGGPLPESFPQYDKEAPKLIIDRHEPHVTISTAATDQIFVSSPRRFGYGWVLKSGRFIALGTIDEPAWLMLDVNTSQLVLHTSRHPLEPSSSAVWMSPNWHKFQYDGKPGNEFFAVFQGDGNLVIYCGSQGVAWASSTNGGEQPVHLEIFGPRDPGGMRLDLLGQDFKAHWSSQDT